MVAFSSTESSPAVYAAAVSRVLDELVVASPLSVLIEMSNGNTYLGQIVKVKPRLYAFKGGVYTTDRPEGAPVVWLDENVETFFEHETLVADATYLFLETRDDQRTYVAAEEPGTPALTPPGSYGLYGGERGSLRP